MININYNPDVLTCLANLSNDEVFTPPNLVNEMLDMLPKELWSNKNIKFLDPATKSGVFLREIAKRLIEGLEKDFPDMQERIDHIFGNQLYGIAITELTSLLSRRSTYCSKMANGEYSVSRSFTDESGNVRYKRQKHTWKNGNCIYCGANDKYKRNKELETHAYNFIHTDKPEEIFNMKFDVIIGNPPYQLSDGGHGASAMPIYQKFVQQAKKLNPRYLSMIIPSRWFTGGRALESFRKEMLNDKSIRILHDFKNASECFPNVEIKGGVNYFLWDRDNKGECDIYTHEAGDNIYHSKRYLLEEELNIFIRDSRSIAILRKVKSKNEKLFYNIMSANDPFGYDVRVKDSYVRVRPDFKFSSFENSLEIFYFGWRKDGVKYIERESARKGEKYIDAYKVFVPRAWGKGDPKTDKLNPFIGKPNSVCTETYSVIGPFASEEECKNVISYINTKFFHYMVSLVKITQAAAKHVYKFVPMQDFSKSWSDEELFKKYDLSDQEIEYIKSIVRTMDGEDNE